MKSSRNPDDEYLVDMALGTCSCKQGMDGSPCSHQAAVVLHFHHRSLNFIPTMHAKSRRHLAYIALGDKVETDLNFYASLSQKNIENSHTTEEKTDTYGPDFSNSAWAVISAVAREDEGECTKSEHEDEDMEVQLEETFQDMKKRLKENDPQLKAGFKKFIKRYNKMTQTKTTALLTSALHCFGSKSGGFATTLSGGRLRRGPRIPIQATAAGRRKTGTRGKGAIPKGRPVTAAQKATRPWESRHCMPVRRKPKGKRPHNLTESINKGQQNAGKW